MGLKCRHPRDFTSSRPGPCSPSHALYKGHQTFVFVMLGPHGINTFFLRVSLTIAAQKRCVLSLD
uniref:Uncharacterized protein n=1 Tax=Anguilla anguilla TaxID=7936 RepID=A0A0E9SW65_ANGAN